MAYTIVLHLTDDDAIVGEVEQLPATSDFLVKLTNPRRLDGSELRYLTVGVAEVIWPMHRINFIEMMPSDEEQIIGFVRE